MSETIIPRVDRITDYAKQLWPYRTRILSWRLLKRSRLNEASGCLVWFGAHDDDGYGIIRVGGPKRLTHRIAYAMWVGELLKGDQVLHSCDNPPCISPYHLFKGNALVNNRDCRSKGRSVNVRGEQSPKSKLREYQVREIRRIYKFRDKHFSSPALARAYGVSPGLISAIIRKDIWRHLQ